MKKTVLGELEELVLLVVAASTEEVYGCQLWNNSNSKRVEASPSVQFTQHCID
jgi:hypothetical protein